MEAFDIESELSIGNFTLFVIPLLHPEHQSSTAFSLVFDGVEVGTLYKGEDSVWEYLEEGPWNTEDLQIIGYQIEKYQR